MTKKLTYLALVIALIAFVMAGNPDFEEVKIDEEIKSEIKYGPPFNSSKDCFILKQDATKIFYKSGRTVAISQNATDAQIKDISNQDNVDYVERVDLKKCYWKETIEKPKIIWYGFVW